MTGQSKYESERGHAWEASGDERAWIPTLDPWTLPHFMALSGWLERRRRDVEEDLEAASHLGYPARLRQGLQRQLARLKSLVVRDGSEPYCRGFGRHWRADGQDPVASALLNGYGPDPREAFVAAMTLRGVEPFGRVIDAGARLRRFHVVGDALGTMHGWAILHRCPPAGTFGSYATGVTHRWAADPDDISRLATQFAQDEARAHAFLDEIRKAA